MQIVIPMAGSGQRFLDEGYKTIKPLIEVDGKTMIEHVVKLFPGEEDFLFICNNAHLQSDALPKVLRTIMPKGIIVGIEGPTAGPVKSVVQVLKHIQDYEPVIFSYCDYNILWDYEKFKEFARTTATDGIVVSYTGFQPHLMGPNFYAGVKTDERGRILEIKEKYSYDPDKLKGWHSAGLYYFKSGLAAKKYFEQHATGAPHDNGEYYISTVYNDLIKAGGLCLNYPVEYFCQWGTPEDLREYNLWMQRIMVNYKPVNEDEKNILDYWKKYIVHK